MLDNTFKMVMFWTVIYYLSGGFAFQKSWWKLWKSNALVALIICLAIGLSSDYVSSKQSTPADNLQYWIDPYPIIFSPRYAPYAVTKARRAWRYESPHSPNQVLMYYDDPKLRRDWTLSYSDPKSRSLIKDGWQMDITASGYAKGSVVMYTLRKAGP